MVKRRVVPVWGPRHWTNYHYQAGYYPYRSLVRTDGDVSYSFLQETETSGHAWPSKAKRGTTDVGGDFSTSRIIGITDNDHGEYYLSGFNIGKDYKGGQTAVNPQTAINDALAAVTPSSLIYMNQKGSTAISRCLPTNPVADAGTFIGELKSGLPKLVGKDLFKTKFKDYRKIGDEYLNVEFGWKPIISDLQKFGTAAIESEKILKQLERDSGRNIRRKYTFPEEQSYNVTNHTNRVAALTGGTASWSNWYKNATGSTLEVCTLVTTKTWFSGCFTYHLNLGTTLPDRMARHAAEARKLYGVELTPATVWNLAPWSWAVDWEGNIGDVLHNVSRFSQDGLVMRYGYIMQQKTAKIDYTLRDAGRLKGSPSGNLTLNVVAESKARRRATPFGFGFDMTALTGRQSAILGALGIARGPRHS